MSLIEGTFRQRRLSLRRNRRGCGGCCRYVALFHHLLDGLGGGLGDCSFLERLSGWSVVRICCFRVYLFYLSIFVLLIYLFYLSIFIYQYLFINICFAYLFVLFIKVCFAYLFVLFINIPEISWKQKQTFATFK